MQSERIKEFLKYASPRLDYIEHCMEKKSARILKFLRRSANSKKLVKNRLNDSLDIQREMGMNTNLKTPWVNDTVSKHTMASLIPNYSEAVKALTDKGYTPTQARRIVEKARLRTLATDNYTHGVDMYPNMANQLHISNTFWKPEATKRLYDMSPTPPPAKPKPVATKYTPAPADPAGFGQRAVDPWLRSQGLTPDVLAYMAQYGRMPDLNLLSKSPMGVVAKKLTRESKAKELDDAFYKMYGRYPDASAKSVVMPTGKPSKVTADPKATPAAPKAIPADWRQLGDSYNTSVRQLDALKKGKPSKVPAEPAVPQALPADWRQLGDSYNTAIRQLDELKKGKPSKVPANKGDAPKADVDPSADNATGWWGDFSEGVGNWAKEHPVLTPAIAAGVTAPIAGGVGYGIGHDSGNATGSSTAAAYWQMREALRNHQLRGANSEFLTRLANLFGGGDLSRLIG